MKNSWMDFFSVPPIIVGNLYRVISNPRIENKYIQKNQSNTCIGMIYAIHLCLYFGVYSTELKLRTLSRIAIES
jgi:hypothetical protein